MKRSELKKKFKKEYPRLKGVCIRYGMSTDFLQDAFIEGKDQDYDFIKRTMIMNWAENPGDIVEEETDNVYINAMKELKPTERMVFNMKCVDSFDFETISTVSKINKDLVINYYNKAKTKLENNEKVIATINSNDAICV